jgi:hypothetical protein
MKQLLYFKHFCCFFVFSSNSASNPAGTKHQGSLGKCDRAVYNRQHFCGVWKIPILSTANLAYWHTIKVNLTSNTYIYVLI